MTPNDIFLSLSKKPFLSVPFPIAEQELTDSVASFLQFLALPQQVKTHIDFKLPTRHRRGDIGYALREASDEDYRDSKEFFHYHPLILSTYADFLRTQPVVENFVKRADRIWRAVYDVVYQLLKNLDERFPGTSDKVFATEHPHLLLRFLRYDWQTSGTHLAKPHFDAGSFTLAIAESGPGLRIGTNPDDLTLVSHREQHAIFMLSSNFRKLIDTNELHAGWHDVIQMDETKIGKPFARWAIVTFIEGADVEALPRSQTHAFAPMRHSLCHN